MAKEELKILFMFHVKRGKSDEFVDAWNEGIRWLKTQSGWRGEELLRSHDDPNIFMSLLEWSDANSFKDAASKPSFQSVMNKLPLREDVTLASYSIVSRGAERMVA